jgi:exodeoxyribonuclease VII large subunit
MSDRLQSDVRLLQSLDPTRVLSRGYAIVRGVDGKAVVSVNVLHSGDDVTIRLEDGEKGARITGKKQLTQEQLL